MKKLKISEQSFAALREREQKLAGIVEAVTDVMAMLDSQLNIVWANDVAKKIFGHDIVGKKCYSFYHGRDKACEPCIVKQCFEDGGIHQFETKIIKTDDKHRFFWCTASVAARHKEAYTLSSRQAITSGGLEPVSDAGFGNNSVFSYFLVKTLEENKDPFLVPSAFFSSIRAGVAENAEQFPQFGSLKDTGGQQGGELVLFLKQDARLQNLSDITNNKLKKIERLQQMELEAKEARRKEAEEIFKREKDLAELDAKIEAMKNRLGTSAVSTDDSLDNMLAMVKQKEVQKKRLDDLRRQKEEDERKRNDEIAKLRKEREDKIITALIPEVEKYKKIISSEFGKSMKSEAWQSLIAKCPPGWADGVDEGNTQSLLWTPEERPIRLKELKIQEEKQKTREKIEAINGKEIGSDGRFIAYATGVVYDKNTGLEWLAGPDSDTTWDEAKSWVANLTVAGGGWRMPTCEELRTLYQGGIWPRNVAYVAKTTGREVWTIDEEQIIWDDDGSRDYMLFKFNYKSGICQGNAGGSYSNNTRGFAVRSRR